MKNLIIHIVYVIAFIQRHKFVPDNEWTNFVVGEQVREPWRNLLGNAWSWAELLPPAIEEAKPAVVRYDGDGGEHALNIYYNLVEFANWRPGSEPIDLLILRKAEMFWLN